METEILFRVCKTCGINKELETGYWKQSRKDNTYSTTCKDCMRKRASENYIKNKDKIIERANRNKERNRAQFYAGLVGMPETHRCSACSITKPSTEFCKNSTTKSGLSYVCKECQSEAGKDWQRRNKERNSKNKKAYAATHREVLREASRRHRAKNIEKVRKDAREAKRRDYQDPDKKIVLVLRNRLYAALFGESIPEDILDLLGCSSDEAKKFLEAKFYPNPKTGEKMGWFNHGRLRWEIDHIIPVVFFDLKTEEGRKRAFSASNMQPLWHKDHKLKHKIWRFQPPEDITFEELQIIWKDFLNGGLTFRLYGLPCL